MKDASLSPAGVVSIGKDLECHRFVSTKIQPNKIIDVTLLYKTYKNGELIQTIREESRVGIITLRETHELLEKTGFKIINEFSDYNLTPFKDDDPLLIIEAEKNN